MKPKAWTKCQTATADFPDGPSERTQPLNDTEWLQHCTITGAIAEHRVLIPCTTCATQFDVTPNLLIQYIMPKEELNDGVEWPLSVMNSPDSSRRPPIKKYNP